MNNPIGIFQGPNAPDPIPPQADFKQVVKNLTSIQTWATNLTYALNSYLITVRAQLNSATQGIGPTLASANSIAVSYPIHYISGVAQINTITPPGGFSGPLWLIALGKFSIGTSGNIAVSGGPYAVGEFVELVFDPAAALWYPAQPGTAQTNFASTAVGTWTPTLSSDGTIGAVTYTHQIGDYVQTTTSTQQWTTLTFYVSWSAASGFTGNAGIGGLPFTSISTANHFYDGLVGNWTGLTLTANYTEVACQVQPNTTFANLLQSGSGQNNANIAVTGVSSPGQLVGNVVYRTA